MSDYKIMIVDDEPDILILLEKALNIEGFFNIAKIESGISAVDTCKKINPDIVILDVMLPDIDGYEVCKRIRQFSHCPILFLSSKNDEVDKILGLAVGGDDYVTKPFSSAELLARVRTTLRNYRHSSIEGKFPGGKFKLRKMEIDYDARQIFVCGEEIKLSQTEYNIVALLSEHCGKMMTYSSIIKAVWGYSNEGSTKKLQVNMANIRRKFGVKPGESWYITNELGVGYRMS